MNIDTTDTSDNDTNADNNRLLQKKKRKHYNQKFRNEWTKHQEFSSWLRKDPKDEYKAVCFICNANMLADLHVLKRHGLGNKHINKLKLSAASSSKQQTILSAFKAVPVTETQMVKTAEVKLAAFVAEHKISHNVMNHLTDLLPKIFPDSIVAKSIKMKSTKVQATINNCIGAAEKCSLVEDLKLQKFSILMDESTDIAVVKTLAIVVRYYDPNMGKVVSRFWDLVQLFDERTIDHSATAEKIFHKVIESFNKHMIPLQNIIGFGSDGCSTMMGCHNSVSSRFRQYCPGITVLKCICHSLHLCASDACKELPTECEKLCRDIYNYFKTSSKRLSELREFQRFAEVDIHKILRPSQTRWLSLSAVVERIVTQWEALRLYFDSKWLIDTECEQIHANLNNSIIKAYYYFLAYMLPKFTHLNTFFQSESAVIIELDEKITEFYQELLLILMPRKYVNSVPIATINPTDDTKYRNIEDMYLGLGVQKQLLLVENGEEILKFRRNCKKFIVKACVGIRKRYSINDKVLSAISKLSPQKCFTDGREETLANLYQLLPRISPESTEDQQTLDDEWRKLPLYVKETTFDLNEPHDQFWHKVTYIFFIHFIY